MKMKLMINGKEYEMKFGIGFIKKLDQIYPASMNGVEFGMGIEQSMFYFKTKNPTVLFNVIKAATDHLNSKPSNNDIEEELEKIASESQLNGLFETLEHEMRESVFLKQKIEDFEEKAKVQQ
ncbi:tail assembly chaperone [Bacillus norwichensis]|uniref:Tail assembly chaperone n=1 Tax=Bacillus norwichensis TaxID=2762217 RepID=A0ABR8VP40_9BACI|nr:tail assembly chaperone [Bacillus norwichensis]MBD8006530.1 tail assembly chaperone [Bacillus norwichensis]